MGRFALGCLALSACAFHAGQASSGGGDDASPGIDARGDAPMVGGIDARVDAASDAMTLPTIPLDCLDAFQHGVTTDGVITIDPDGSGSNAPFQAYCDMTTSGGGWTLAWVYGFTDYSHFTNGGNAVTPRPTWGVPTSGGTPTSTTAPLAPTTPGAIDFARWATLGGTLLVESNVNHWITCTPGTGSLVTKTSGSMTCSIVQLVATACTNVVPTRVELDTVSLGLFATSSVYSTYYYWEGSTQTQNWPTHDPCGSNMANQVTGVANPYGAIYLRR